MSWIPDIDGPIEGLAGYGLNVTPDFRNANPHVGPFVVDPPLLKRVWTGDDPADPSQTVPLLFADEAEARSCLPDAWIGD